MSFTGCSRCEAEETVCFADEICEQCGHVALCADCRALHIEEAREDDVLKEGVTT